MRSRRLLNGRAKPLVTGLASTFAMKATTRFRQLLAEPGIITAPGAYDCLTAAIIERTGFPAVYMTGPGPTGC